MASEFLGDLHGNPQRFAIEQRQDVDVKGAPGVIRGDVGTHIGYTLG